MTEQRMTTAFIRLMALVAAVYFFARVLFFDYGVINDR